MSAALEAALISRVEAMESQLKASEERVAFVGTERDERALERDRWRETAAKLEERVASLTRELAAETERAQRFGLLAHRLEQDAVGLRRRAEAAETNLGVLTASKTVVVFTGELGEFTGALVDVVERLKATHTDPSPETDAEAAQ